MSDERYLRRYEREKAARAEAESIAERATRDLYQALESQEAILRCAGDAILAADAGGTIHLANPRAHQMLGVHELAGRDLHASIHPSGQCPPSCLMKRALQGQAAVADAEMDICPPGVPRFPGSVTIAPLSRGGEATGFVITMRDATLRRQAEAARVRIATQQQELRRLKELDALKTDFMNTAAHELRTPLTPIRTELYLLNRVSDRLDDSSRKSVEIVVRNFERLARLVEDVLEGARIQAGQLGFRFDETDLGAVVQETVDTFRSTIEQKGVVLHAELAGSLQVQADGRRLGQVVSNLLSNAVKFTPAGGTIRIAARPHEAGARVEVADSGVGLTPEESALLFRPFSQVGDHSTHANHGAGLGLYICKGIVEHHGGRIWVESGGAGKGSTFAFQVPGRPPAMEAAS